MMLNLPLELLNLIFDQFEYQQDFQSLLACALTTKLLVRIALERLYGIHSYSKILYDHDFYNQGFGAPEDRSRDRVNICHRLKKEFALQREVLWKSIILSSIGKTTYPYCLYIRTLHLNDLVNLLQEACLFRTVEITDQLFTGDMAQFFPRLNRINKIDKPSEIYYCFDFSGAIQRIGYSIISCINGATIQPRPLSNIQHLFVCDKRMALKNWVSLLPKLRTLETRDVAPFTPDLAQALGENCPDFCNLIVSSSGRRKQDEELAFFLHELKQNTLRKLFISGHFVAAETLFSLSHHAESLTSLKMFGVLSVAAKKLGLLHVCRSLITVELSFSVPGSIPIMPGLVRIKNDQQDAIIDWLCGCRNLRELSVENLSKGVAILTEVCSKEWIRLRKLKLMGFRFGKSLDFFRILSLQTDLHHLHLGGDPEFCRPCLSDIFLDCLASLRNLKYLRLAPDFGLAYYSMNKAIDVILNIPRVEELIIACRYANDTLWMMLSTLHNLRALRINGIADFTFEGIFEYINTLRATNKGLSISIISQNKALPITKEQQLIIQCALHEKVDGCFVVDHR